MFIYIYIYSNSVDSLKCSPLQVRDLLFSVYNNYYTILYVFHRPDKKQLTMVVEKITVKPRVSIKYIV